MKRKNRRSDHLSDTARAVLHLGLDDAVLKGEGYEALITRNGIVIGRAYLGTISEFEDESR